MQTKIKLKKIYREKWMKKRGSSERQFSGHEVQYFIDDVPVQEKDYNARIADLAGDESRFRLLTSPTTFPALHWQKQRALLLEVCGDISDLDVIASNEKLSPLPAILGKRTLDDHRKVVIARRSEINKEMEKIPVRIDEVRRSMPDTTGLDMRTLEKEILALESSLNDSKLRLQGVNTGGRIADLTKQLSGIQADIRKIEEAHRSGTLTTLNKLNQDISETEAKLNAAKRHVLIIDGDLKAKYISVKSDGENISKLRDQWAAIDAETFQDSTESVCYACNQPLPSDKVQASRDKALAAFNVSKAERLKEIQQKGLSLKERQERFQGEMKALYGEKQGLVEVDIPALQARFDSLSSERDFLKHNSEDFSEIKERYDLLSQITEYEAQIKAEREGKAQDIEKVKAEITGTQATLKLAKDQYQLFISKAHSEARMDELKTEEKKLSREFEKLEGELYLMDLFIKTKVSLLTDRINAKFETVRFKLFNILINGGIEECCEITVNGIPYNGGLNNAARIQAGCDIIRTLQEHYGMKAPVFVDNRESVSEIPSMGCQLISLVVSPEDKVLRVETQKSEVRRAA